MKKNHEVEDENNYQNNSDKYSNKDETEILPQYKQLENLSKLLNLETNKYLSNNRKKTIKNNYNSNSRDFDISSNNKVNNLKEITKNLQNKITKKKSNLELYEIKKLLTPQVLQSLGLSNMSELNKPLKKSKNRGIQTSSLLEISPEVLESNYTPKSPNEVEKIDGPSNWTPPKPVLFDNFQDNLGSQLKDISQLTK